MYQQSPTAAIILGGLIAVTVCVAVLWLLDLRGKTNWKPHTEYEPPRMERREPSETRQTPCDAAPNPQLTKSSTHRGVRRE